MNKIKFKIYKAKLFRWLGITKPIPLTGSQVEWIKLIKGHYKNKYSYKGSWTDILMPMFNERYGWEAEDYYSDYLSCMFNVLLTIHLKIQDDKSGYDMQLLKVFKASFYPSISNDQTLPIERAISMLCSHIQFSTVFENDVERFKL